MTNSDVSALEARRKCVAANPRAASEADNAEAAA